MPLLHIPDLHHVISGGISWGRLGSADHMFSLPITTTAHLGQRGFARADSYAARHSMLESQTTLGKTSSGFHPAATNAFSRSGRHSTPIPTHTTTSSSRSTGRNSSRAQGRSSEVGTSLAIDTAEALAESKPYARGSVAYVGVDASSSVAMSEPSSLVGNESSYRSSSSSSHESESHTSVPPQLRIISLDQESGRIISADSPRGSARVLAWHPSSVGGEGTDSRSVTSEMSATSTGNLARIRHQCWCECTSLCAQCIDLLAQLESQAEFLLRTSCKNYVTFHFRTIHMHIAGALSFLFLVHHTKY